MMQLKTLALTLISSLTVGTVMGDSGYYDSCHNFVGPLYGGSPGVDLAADCREESGIYALNVFINLSGCFANAGGQLVGRPSGGFDGSCNDVSISGSTLYASCNTGNGNYVGTSIDMNDWIGNYNGVMTCFGSTWLV